MDSERNEYHLTEEDWETIVAIWDWDLETRLPFDMLYHYYGGATLKKVIKSNSIVFRLASAALFQDKMEGKAVEVYYDLALEELFKEGLISEELLEKLSGISVPDEVQFVFQRQDGWGICKTEKQEEYIICFSTQKDDLYMFENYAHDNGYCLHFFGLELEDLKRLGMKNHAKISLVPILYGREVVDYIKQKISEILSDPAKTRNLDYFIADLLHYVQFTAKRKKYSKEHEVRLIIFLPQNCEERLENVEFYTDKDGKKYIYFSSPRHVLYDVSPAPYNTKEQIKAIKDYLTEQGYSNMLKIDRS